MLKINMFLHNSVILQIIFVVIYTQILIIRMLSNFYEINAYVGISSFSNYFFDFIDSFLGMPVSITNT
jgi:hypothetical protein